MAVIKYGGKQYSFTPKGWIDKDNKIVSPIFSKFLSRRADPTGSSFVCENQPEENFKRFEELAYDDGIRRRKKRLKKEELNLEIDMEEE
jgi:hypothetical protein